VYTKVAALISYYTFEYDFHNVSIHFFVFLERELLAKIVSFVVVLRIVSCIMINIFGQNINLN
jgi:hypothetical protein